MKTSFLLVFAGLVSVATAAEETLVLEKTIPLPGVNGRFDHFSIDPEKHLLAVAALGNDTVEVFDLASGTHASQIKGQKKPCGVLFVPGKSRLIVANGDDGTVRSFDTKSWQAVAEITGLDDADNVRHDTTQGRAIVGYGEGALAIIDESGNRVLGKVRLNAHPEAFQLESGGKRAFVNVPGAKQIAVVDLAGLTVSTTWPLEKWRSNFPMALDDQRHLLFTGCRSPARVVAIDTGTGKVATDCEIAGDTDDVFFDAKRQRIYASCGEGYLDTIELAGDGKLHRIGHQPTRSGARTCFYSAATDRLYLAVPHQIGRDAELRIYRPSPQQPGG